MTECPEPTSSGNTSANITSNLPVKIEDLVNSKSVEGQRLEFKASWNNGPTKFQVIRTTCAFANDNSGFIVIGVEESKKDKIGEAIVLPPKGINPNDMERIQKEILGACTSLISPSYSPILSEEVVQNKHVLVIWAQASDDRPHRARVSKNGEYCYFIRKGPMTTKANDKDIKSLHENSSKIPFDDRMAKSESGKRIPRDAIDDQLVRAFLNDVNSQMERGKVEDVLQKLRLVVPCDALIDGDIKPVFTPRNVALLMFNNSPQLFFPSAKIEVIQMTRDNEVIFKKVFTGPLQSQIKKCVDYVHSTTNYVSAGVFTYPREAFLEAIVNAVYHRRYEPEYNNSTKVLMRPHCLEIISYPGQHLLSPKQEIEFISGYNIRPVPARNVRIGEFFRLLRLAEACWTGVQTIFRTMKRNGNPTPKFDFNSDYFRVILPAHPKFQAENVCMLYHMLYHHEWKLEKLEIVWKHDARSIE